jgi:serine/threonine-protein kinase
MAGTKRLVQAIETRWLPEAIIDCRYRLLQFIGRGGHAEVWRAEPLDGSRGPVAIKRLLQPTASEQARRRFQREMEALKKLRHHPNIVTLEAYGEHHGQDYLVMEHLSGQTLEDWLRWQHAVPLQLALAILAQICSALQAAHAQKIVHRDLKPSNIMMRPESDLSFHVKVLDFGVARVGERLDTNTGDRVGTEGYMSPEQTARGWGDICPASDVFAIGVLAIEILTLRAGSPDRTGSPYANYVVQRWEQLAAELTAARPDVPPVLWEAITRALRPQVRDRPANAGALWRELERATPRWPVAGPLARAC